MFAPVIGAEVGRVIVNQFDIAHQRDPGIRALDQVVAQQRVFGEAAFQHRAHDVHFVNALAGETAFGKKVLIDVRNSARVNIETGFP